MEERRRDDVLIGMALGLGAAAFLGLVVYMIWSQRKLSGASLGALPPSTQPSPITNIYNISSGPPATSVAAMPPVAVPVMQVEPLTEAVAQTEPSSHDTALRTVTLTTTRPSRIATAASSNPWNVTLRVLGPAGTWAVFATDPARLKSATVMSDDVTVLPSGQETTIRLNPRQVIYGVGSASTVSATSVTTEILPAGVPSLRVVKD